MINWFKIIKDKYNVNAYFSEYGYCDYIVNGKTYISTFYLIDTEKIARINLFLENNTDTNIDVLCNKNIYEILTKMMPTANVIPIIITEKEKRTVRFYE